MIAENGVNVKLAGRMTDKHAQSEAYQESPLVLLVEDRIYRGLVRINLPSHCICSAVLPRQVSPWNKICTLHPAWSYLTARKQMDVR